MTTIHLSHDARVGHILRAAADTIVEQGIDAVTIKSVAQRAGVSRQWIYEFFPDLDAILVALFYEAQRHFFVEVPKVGPHNWDYGDHVKERSRRFLDMPPAFAIVTSFALNGGTSRSSTGARLRDLIIQSLEDAWVRPLQEFGYTREDVFGSVLAVTNAALGLNIAVHEGLTSLDVAERRLNAIVDAIIGMTSMPV